MPGLRWCCVASLAAAAWFAAGSVASAETCTLQLKRLEGTPDGGVRPATEQEWRYRAHSSQRFSMSFGERMSRQANAEEEFRKIVKKEPAKYVSKEPFRGVAKLGSGKFAFVLDAKDEKSKGYDRLYFDLNGNGDLTDDKPIDSATKEIPRVGYVDGYSNHAFPRVDLTVPLEGKSLEYSFLFSVYSYGSKDYRYVSASLTAAAYRVGEITLDGKKRKIALLDDNGNGRFDDQPRIPGNVFYSGGGTYAEMGDALLIDPEKTASPMMTRGYGDESRQYVSKLTRIGEKFYDLKVSPAGDAITIAPSKLKIGHLTNSRGSLTGMLYGDHGFLSIRGEAGKAVAVPEGEWKLLAYSVGISGWKPPPEADKKGSDEKSDKSKGLLQTLRKALGMSVETRAEPRYGPSGQCSLDANGTAKCKPITIRGGQSVAFPFGPPYKPVVEAHVARSAAGGQAELSMSLVGSGGESVSNLVVDGYRPPKPEFTITDPKGEVVQKGSFEYG